MINNYKSYSIAGYTRLVNMAILMVDETNLHTLHALSSASTEKFDPFVATLNKFICNVWEMAKC